MSFDLDIKTADDLEAERAETRAETIRADRDRRLAACDWTQVADAPVDQAAWRAYRQALRDVTDQPEFPDAVTWPEEPEQEQQD